MDIILASDMNNIQNHTIVNYTLNCSMERNKDKKQKVKKSSKVATCFYLFLAITYFVKIYL